MLPVELEVVSLEGVSIETSVDTEEIYFLLGVRAELDKLFVIWAMVRLELRSRIEVLLDTVLGGVDSVGASFCRYISVEEELQRRSWERQVGVRIVMDVPP